MEYSATDLPVRPLTGLMKALGDDTRLRIVALLAHGELCVCHLASALELGQPNTSQHLGVLRNAGVVDSSRRGNWVYYRLIDQDDPVRQQVLHVLTRGFGASEALGEDVRRLQASRLQTSCA